MLPAFSCSNNHHIKKKRLRRQPFLFSSLVAPTAVIVINHELCHAAVNRNVLSGDESGLVRTEKHDHLCNIQRISHAARRLLHSVRSLVYGIGCVNPAGRYRIDPRLSGKAHCQRMGKRCNAALGRRVAFGLRLTHPVS